MNVPIPKLSPPVGSGAITVTSATAIGVGSKTSWRFLFQNGG
jgi:hypothetical protein